MKARTLTKKLLPSLRRWIRAIEQALLEAACKVRIRTNEYNYEPVTIDGQFFAGRRDSESRWTAIKAELNLIAPGSLLDVGCAEGWFIRRAAEDCGFFALGLESQMERVLPGELARLHDEVANYAVMRATLSPADIVHLPKFDVVMCLSVVHHLVYSAGIENGRRFIQQLGLRCSRLFVFEMGTSDELEMEWASKMPEMPNGQETFIRDFLSSAGFFNIRRIAITASFKKESTRMLFVAEPPEHNAAD